MGATELASFVRSHCGYSHCTVLLSCGSFNPPTKAHMEMFARARQALLERGEQCVLGVMSPVNDAYKKPGLAPASHRLRMCALAAADYPWIAVDPWESQQDSYRRTMFVIRRLRDACRGTLPASVFVSDRGMAAAGEGGGAGGSKRGCGGGGCVERTDAGKEGDTSRRCDEMRHDRNYRRVGGDESGCNPPGTSAAGEDCARVLLLCGSDMLASFASPGVWLLDHMREILEDFGVVCCVRGENPVPQLPPELRDLESRIVWVGMPPNVTSSTRVRQSIANGDDIAAQMTAPGVLAYAREHGLYVN